MPPVPDAMLIAAAPEIPDVVALPLVALAPGEPPLALGLAAADPVLPAALAGLPGVVLPVPVGLPDAAAAAAAQPPGRGPNVLPHPLLWENIVCPSCGRVSGQKKYHPGPGMRDAPSWYMRIYDFPHDTWPTRLPGYKCKAESAMGGDPGNFISNWILENRTCCPL